MWFDIGLAFSASGRLMVGNLFSPIAFLAADRFFINENTICRTQEHKNQINENTSWKKSNYFETFEWYITCLKYLNEICFPILPSSQRTYFSLMKTQAVEHRNTKIRKKFMKIQAGINQIILKHLNDI